ncbi:MAG: 2-C-methyl-D-erythritol 4-phosphate cytidylyltransferase [Deltaproteobacteria bacterium CG_4_10_14_0_2_um_filter_43_8]|nr:MAG: 2-C-methyl-D-erythritol 4-phosphate cytidylyltransferase [Deltaproteobacteria bacterium CG11_big_fil_rev_8_21_14_0_20_42_23]PJA21051.1 MAG: 2-C-methyl-D-erythritol 4-phosphate cytidylyltransferase [Deltaproteobacteria bacterium CG_4_10_14_0_2_um_filter_43_8]PJC64741.1 MAG: 2-C-methyl-D-erythritol 4-phosphate cytidylyltransferase [Deltaproteobacteria bacterium CG_4_9_14_0_2_um_filter_42_21]
MSRAIIIPAAGIGKRMEANKPKQYLLLRGKPLLCYTLEIFRAYEHLVLAVEAEMQTQVQKDIVEYFNFPKTWKVITGGKQRQDSVYEGIKALHSSCNFVCIHDAVRPFVKPKQVEELFSVAEKTGAVVFAARVKDTLKKANAENQIAATVDRASLWRAQTPQVFQLSLLKKAFEDAYANNVYGTDDAMLVERLGHVVSLFEGNDFNIKITTPEDLDIAELYVEYFSQK